MNIQTFLYVMRNCFAEVCGEKIEVESPAVEPLSQKIIEAAADSFSAPLPPTSFLCFSLYLFPDSRSCFLINFP